MKTEMASKTRNRLLTLIMDRERQLGRRIQQIELAQELGVSEQLIGRWIKNHVTLFDGEVIAKLCEYFECEVGDLLYIERDKQGS